MHDRTRLVVASLVGLMGLVWLLQGLGAPIGGSFMVGDPFWAWAGGATAVGAVIFAAWPRLRGRRPG